jgi:short-subunit dehydrogenase involved in D-alanine esterification of teichoic acids
MKKLQDNVTIITGGGKGIGFGLACAFAKEGSNIVITGRNEARLLMKIQYSSLRISESAVSVSSPTNLSLNLLISNIHT